MILMDPLAVLKVSWLGPPKIEYDGRPLHLEMRKTLALFAYLSLAAHSPTRETLAAMFWPDADQQHALLSLRRCLHSLTRSLPPGLVEAGRESIGLHKDARLQLDVEMFRGCTASARQHLRSAGTARAGLLPILEKAAASYTGDFLEGFSLKDCPQFDAWQRAQCEALRSEYAAVLSQLLDIHREQGNWERSQFYAHHWVELDPLDELAQRKLIELYYLSGQRSAGIRQYESLVAQLQTELGAAPEPETASLYQKILAAVEPGGESNLPVQPVTTAPEPEPLVKTKLYIPPLRKNLVPRQPLLDKLDVAVQKSLVLVSAPAGFGKTTLLTSWATQTSLPIAWYSLDPADNDPVRFVAYLVAALDSLLPPGTTDKLQAFGQTLQPSLQPTLVQLVNALASTIEPFVLILDDYQAIHSMEVHKALAFLVERMPPCLHLVIATRADPPISLARLRASDQLVEIRMGDLRFSHEESDRFFTQSMELQVSQGDVGALEKRTEGWIAGLQMAALAIRKVLSQADGYGASPDRGKAITRFVQDFSGSNRYILDYLSEEVLNRCSPQVQGFLLQTSILDHLSGPLCDAVIGWEGSQETLEGLDRENLFLVAEDNERRWYRFHPIFADILRIKLKELQGRTVTPVSFSLPPLPELHRRAATWLEANSHLGQAVQHYTAAGEVERAAAVIESQAQRMFFITGQAYTLLQWVDALPQDFVRNRPPLELARAWALISQSRFTESNAALTAARQALSEHPGEQSDSLLGEIALLEGALAELSSRDVAVMRTQGLYAWQKLPPDAPMLRGLAAWLLGVSYLYEGNVKDAEEYLRNAILLCREAGNVFVSLLAVVDQCNALREQGKYRQAYHQLMQVDSEISAGRLTANPAVSYIYHGLGQVLFAWNRLDEAERYLKLGNDLAAQDVPGEVLIFGIFSLAYLKLVQGKKDEALILAEECLEKADAYPLPYVPSIVRASMVRFWIRNGDRERIEDWLAGCRLAPGDPVQYSAEGEYITLAKVLIWKKRAADALKVLEKLGELARSQARLGKLVQVLLLQAEALQQGNHPDLALEALEKSLAIAQPEGLISSYLDEGQPVQELLELGFERGLWKDTDLDGFVSRLLEAMKADTSGEARFQSEFS